MAGVIRFPGTVEWSGENPGIFLKQNPDGPFTTLASFFRVVLSSHGCGHALILIQPPSEFLRQPAMCLTDNEPLARWLVSDFVAKFAAFQGNAAMRSLLYRKIDSVESSGDPSKIYSETVKAGDLTVTLTWSGLGVPFCFVNPPELSATGEHHMPSVFVGCLDASIIVNGRRLPGAPIPREVAGRKITTAMLAFSETWIRAEPTTP
jgi:hypothetical protein